MEIVRGDPDPDPGGLPCLALPCLAPTSFWSWPGLARPRPWLLGLSGLASGWPGTLLEPLRGPLFSACLVCV